MRSYHIEQIRLQDPSFEPFLDGLMSVEKGIIAVYEDLTTNRNYSCYVIYLMWRDPSDGQFHCIGYLHNNLDISSMNALMDKRIANKQNEIQFNRESIPLGGVWLLNKDLSFSKYGSTSTHREYPEEILERLATLRATRKEFLARCTESERDLVQVIEKYNIVHGGM